MKASTRRSISILALCTLGAIGYRVYSEKIGPRSNKLLQDLELQAKQKLPMKIDDTTTLVDIKYEKTSTIYWYEVSKRSEEALDLEKIKQSVSAKICSNAEVARTIKSESYTYEYHYKNISNGTSVEFKIASCG